MADELIRKGLAQANTLRSNNTTQTGYGIAYADEISGHRTVADLDSLYKLYDWQLSASGDNTGDDAIGQLWYVVDADGEGNGNLYQLTDWGKRSSAEGWKVFSSGADVKLDGYLKTADAEKVYAKQSALSNYVTNEKLTTTKNEINNSIDNCVKNNEIGALDDTVIDKIWNGEA